MHVRELLIIIFAFMTTCQVLKSLSTLLSKSKWVAHSMFSFILFSEVKSSGLGTLTSHGLKTCGIGTTFCSSLQCAHRSQDTCWQFMRASRRQESKGDMRTTIGSCRLMSTSYQNSQTHHLSSPSLLAEDSAHPSLPRSHPRPALTDVPQPA